VEVCALDFESHRRRRRWIRRESQIFYNI